MAQTGNKEVKVRFTQKAKILTALRNGKEITSYAANSVGNTVDARKYISRLRREGYEIFDYWETGRDGRRYKVYFLDGKQCYATEEWLSRATGFEVSMRTLSMVLYFNKRCKFYLEFRKKDSTIGVIIKTKDLNCIYSQDWEPKYPGDFIARGEVLEILKSVGCYAEDE